MQKQRKPWDPLVKVHNLTGGLKIRGRFFGGGRPQMCQKVLQANKLHIGEQQPKNTQKGSRGHSQ